MGGGAPVVVSDSGGQGYNVDSFRSHRQKAKADAPLSTHSPEAGSGGNVPRE